MARVRTSDLPINVRNLKKDLQNLREDLSQLSKQVEGFATNGGNEILDEIKAKMAAFGGSVDDLISNAGARGREAVDAVGDMGGNVVENVEDAIRERPLTTLAIAVGLGFILSS